MNRILLLLIAAGIAVSCATYQDIRRAVANLSSLQFKLHSVSDFQLVGFPLKGKTGLDVTEGFQILTAFSRKELEASFIVNVAALNPNDGSAGTTRTSATLAGFAWRLFINNRETIQGNIATPVAIPETGEQMLIPLTVKLNLSQFFSEYNFKNIIDLALALGGANSSPTTLTLRATPTVSTPYGPITYPGELEIIDKEFR